MKAYLDNKSNDVDFIDRSLKIQPIFDNSQAEALNKFIAQYDDYIIKRFNFDKIPHADESYFMTKSSNIIAETLKVEDVKAQIKEAI